MREALALIRAEPRARVFFAALAQSSLGTGAAYVGLLVIAYERFHSAWAISLILLADFAPAMFLAPFLGAATDRWSRRWCAVFADVIRAAAFGGIVLVGGFGATLALALVAGLGTALFRPAVLSALPTLVSPQRSPAATSLYGAITDAGYTVGPAIAAGLMVVFTTETIMLVNGASFAISAVVLASLPFGDVSTAGEPDEASSPSSFLRDVREGLTATAGMPAVRLVISGAAVGMFFGGIFNVVELPFVTDVLDAKAYAFSLLVAAFGVGFAVGSLTGSKGGEAPWLKRRYLQGLLLMGVGDLAAGAAVNVWPALPAFALAGFGNGLFLVHERLLFQTQVPNRLQGRVFAVSDAVVAWGFAAAFLSAGALAAAIGPRPVVLLAGVGGMANAIIAALALRTHWPGPYSTGSQQSRGERRTARQLSAARARLQATLRALLAPGR
jgi:MFS family permease